jgi:hypothetical protein
MRRRKGDEERKERQKEGGGGEGEKAGRRRGEGEKTGELGGGGRVRRQGGEDEKTGRMIRERGEAGLEKMRRQETEGEGDTAESSCGPDQDKVASQASKMSIKMSYSRPPNNRRPENWPPRRTSGGGDRERERVDRGTCRRNLLGGKSGGFHEEGHVILMESPQTHDKREA